ncbi:hypothetical protein MRX96_030715 [Rhipicephalus microplus]
MMVSQRRCPRANGIYGRRGAAIYMSWQWRAWPSSPSPQLAGKGFAEGRHGVQRDSDMEAGVQVVEKRANGESVVGPSPNGA